MATTTLTKQLEELLDRDVRTAIQCFPDFLQVRFKDYLGLQEELDTLRTTLKEKGGGWFGRGKKMPDTQIAIYKTRVADIEGQIKGLIDVSKAIQSGYQPYTMPRNWYAGYIESEPPGIRRDDSEFYRGNKSITKGVTSLGLQFVAPIPSPTLVKYEEAKKSGLFGAFVIASPDKSLFWQVQSLFCEPALIGFVSTNRSGVRLGQPFTYTSVMGRDSTTDINTGLEVREGVGFLIDMWDLEKDRKAAGLKF